MANNFVSPGVGQMPSVNISVPTSSGVPELGYLKPHYFPKKVLQAGHAQMFRPDLDLQIKVTGINIVTNHLEAMEALLPGAMWVIQNRLGEHMTERARVHISDMGAIDTGDTLRSVHHFVSTTANEIMTSVGPTTFYAPLIEYGLGSHLHIGPRPFMMMALSDSFPEWVQAYVDLATIARQGARGRITATGYKSPLEAYLAKWRQHLYSLEKELGDIVVIPGVGIPGVSGLRENLLGAARVIGDLQAVMGSAIGARFTRRLTGKVTGRAIGIGSRTIFANKVYVAGPISFGNRIYNRMAGKYASKYTRLGGL